MHELCQYKKMRGAIFWHGRNKVIYIFKNFPEISFPEGAITL